MANRTMDASEPVNRSLASSETNDRQAPLLAVTGLEIEFGAGHSNSFTAVRGMDITLRPGHVLGVAGESGSGKSSLALAMIGLVPRGTALRGSIRYRDRELVGQPEAELRKIRGGEIALISQETGGALNPTLKIGQQMRLVLRAHLKLSRQETEARARKALEDVQLRDIDRVLKSFPSELSGGMCQRVVIAMALACGSHVLLADEPTTALDVTVQREIIRLLRELVNDRGLALMMISHDLGVLNEICDELVVMYQGQAVESGPMSEVLHAPSHPYTRGLLNAIPRLANRGADLPTLGIQGTKPLVPGGCEFANRCRWRIDQCDEPQNFSTLDGSEGARRVRCHRATEIIALNPKQT
jgi:oligopeptide/dipeptide ABC transporter ATP-binding protein